MEIAMAIEKFDLKTIRINDDTKKILGCLDKCMKRNNIEELLLTSITPGERDGLKGMLLQSTEYVTNNDNNYKHIHFPAAEVEIGAELMVLYVDYRTYLKPSIQRLLKLRLLENEYVYNYEHDW